MVNDKLINMFINLTLPPTTNYVYFMLQKSLQSKISLIDLHFEYTPDASGCKLAKEDFINRII